MFCYGGLKKNCSLSSEELWRTEGRKRERGMCSVAIWPVQWSRTLTLAAGDKERKGSRGALSSMFKERGLFVLLWFYSWDTQCIVYCNDIRWLFNLTQSCTRSIVHLWTLQTSDTSLTIMTTSWFALSARCNIQITRVKIMPRAEAKTHLLCEFELIHRVSSSLVRLNCKNTLTRVDKNLENACWSNSTAGYFVVEREPD